MAATCRQLLELAVLKGRRSCLRRAVGTWHIATNRLTHRRLTVALGVSGRHQRHLLAAAFRAWQLELQAASKRQWLCSQAVRLRGQRLLKACISSWRRSTQRKVGFHVMLWLRALLLHLSKGRRLHIVNHIATHGMHFVHCILLCYSPSRNYSHAL